MKGCSVLLGGFLAIVTSVAFAADPDFKDYTFTPVFTGINHEPVPQEHSNSMMDKAREQALKGKSISSVITSSTCSLVAAVLFAATCWMLARGRLSAGCRTHTKATRSIRPSCLTAD